MHGDTTTANLARALTRRSFCARVAVAGGGFLLSGAGGARAAVTPRTRVGRGRTLTFEHTHRDDSLSIVYAEDGAYLPEAMRQIDHFLRDHYDDSVHAIDPELLDYLYDVALELDTDAPYQVISAYRSPETNEMLRKRGGLVSRNSLHMQGRAIDVRIDGVSTARLRDAGLDLHRGGVGYYARSDFVHFDTGRARQWSY